MDSRTSVAAQCADWDRKTSAQLDLVESICRSGNSPQCVRVPAVDQVDADAPAATPPAVFWFGSTEEAYNASQSRDDIRDGDVLAVESERVAAVLMGAWPVAVTRAHGQLHTDIGQPGADLRTVEGGRYAVSVDQALALAATFGTDTDADGPAVDQADAPAPAPTDAPDAVWSLPMTPGGGRLIGRPTRVTVRTQPVTVLGPVNFEPSMVRVRTADGAVHRAMREHVTAATAPAPVVDQVAPAAPVAAPAPVTEPVPAPVAPVVDPVAAPAAPAPAVAQPYRATITGRGEVDGYALPVAGKVARDLAKELKRVLYAEREALGGVFWLLTSQRGTLGIVPAEGHDAPADWTRVVARAAELLAASTDVPAGH
jgi:hypothetical protein